MSMWRGAVLWQKLYFRNPQRRICCSSNADLRIGESQQFLLVNGDQRRNLAVVSSGPRVFRHSHSKYVPFSAQQVYDVVIDVESYSKFVPYCAFSKLQPYSPTVQENELIRKLDKQSDFEIIGMAEVAIQFLFITSRYSSLVTGNRETKVIESTAIGQSALSSLHCKWSFEDTEIEGITKVNVQVDFAFRNKLLTKLSAEFLSGIVKKITDSFLDRCHELYSQRIFKK
ncbi:MAG: hypothetical protein MHMPM18_001347 [Marteilia pararefringens]